MAELRPYLLLAVLAILAFANTMQNDFAFDDRGFLEGRWLEENLERPLDAFRRGSMAGSLHWSNPGYYRPVATISKVFDFVVWGRDPRGFHLTNLVLHLACVLLAYGLLRRLLGSGWPSLLGAAIFAVHPAHAESVAFVAGRTDVLYTLFLLTSTILFLDALEKGRLACLALGGSLFAFALALLSKETAACLPVLLIILRKRGSSLGWIAPHGAVLVAFLVLRVGILPSLGTVTRYPPMGGGGMGTLGTMPGVFLGYLSTALVPVPLAVDRNVQVVREILDVRAIIPMLGAVGWMGLAVLARRQRILLHGWAWFTIPLLPVSNIIPIGTIQSDRYLYLPVLGTAIITAWAVDRVRVGRRSVAIGLGVILCGLLLALTIDRNRDWRNDETLWRANLEDVPGSIQARLNLGAALGEAGRHDRAAALFAEAIGLGARDPAIFHNYGISLEATGDGERAIRAYEMAVTLGGSPAARERLGLLLVSRGERDRGRQVLQEALPHSEAAYLQLADLAREEGDSTKELALLEDLVRYHPGSWQGILRLAEVYRDGGMLDRAAALYGVVAGMEAVDPVIRAHVLRQLEGLSER